MLSTNLQIFASKKGGHFATVLSGQFDRFVHTKKKKECLLTINFMSMLALKKLSQADPQEKIAK